MFGKNPNTTIGRNKKLINRICREFRSLTTTDVCAASPKEILRRKRKLESPFISTPIIGNTSNVGSNFARLIITICSPIKFSEPGKLTFAQINKKNNVAK